MQHFGIYRYMIYYKFNKMTINIASCPITHVTLSDSIFDMKTEFIQLKSLKTLILRIFFFFASISSHSGVIVVIL